MTDKELKAEWQYRVTERLGHLCEDREPTQAQRDIALTEANLWLADWRKAQELL